MRTKTKNKLLGLGFDTNLIGKIADRALTVSGMSGLNINALLKLAFTEEEAKIILAKVNRRAIPSAILGNLLRKSGEVCCFCCDGNNTRPYQIHHIEEYHLTRDNDEDNLLLVCPNHHVVIHTIHSGKEEQKQARRIWYSTWQIAFEYKRKGISFPFKSFENIDYGTKGSIIQIFSLTEPMPSVCKQLLQQEIWKETKEILEKENKLIITGNPGSGKTTMAKGIAGNFTDFLVFKFSVGNDSNAAVAEILTFLSVAVKRLLLLIDDANTWLHGDHIEKILKAASPEKKILVVTSRSSNLDTGNLETHFMYSIYPVSWPSLKGAVKKSLVDNADDVLGFLKSRELDYFNEWPIGHGIYDYSFEAVVDRYASEADSVWALIFLLASGIEIIDKIHVDLVNDERIDMVVLLIAINQIAKFESGTSIDEILTFYKISPALNKIPPPERDWLQGKIDKLVKKRFLKIVRGRYNTMHRLFAMKFVEHSYFKTSHETKALIKGFLDQAPKVVEILRLWGAMENTTVLPFIMEWYRSLQIEGWNKLVDAAMQNGLATVAGIAYRMHIIAPAGYVPLKEAFKGKGELIADLINKGGENTLFYLERIIRALKINCFDELPAMLKKIDMLNVLELVKNTNPEYFNDIDGLFNSLISIDVAWVDKFSRQFSQEDFSKIINKIRKGDVDSFTYVIGFQKHYIENIKKSLFKQYAKKIADLIRDCKLKEIQYNLSLNEPLTELFYFPEEIIVILNSLDKDQLSRDFATSSPRHWGNLLTVSTLSRHASSEVVCDILENIDIDDLKTNVEKYYKFYHYELRVFIYQLCYAREKKRKQFAKILMPYITEILQSFATQEIDSVFQAFCTLDLDAGTQIAKCINRSLPQITDFPTFKNDDLHQQIEELDKTGEDYILFQTRFIVLREYDVS